MKKKLESIEIDLGLPFLHIKGVWKPNEAEKNAAWELYVELITRISIIGLRKEEGLLREALTSLYSIFSITREVLRKYGPEVAIPHENADYSLGRLAVEILNYQLRPLLTKWHPLLLDYEDLRKEEITRKSHEDQWEYNKTLRDELDKTSKKMLEYSEYLAKAAGISPLLPKSKFE
ncbi:MAG: hypothetical protein M1431_00755 [Candidatus Thermoplasmatota archaeon]|nr:hypothetical protein [Candidatus Thermoplasmatota archaeon]